MAYSFHREDACLTTGLRRIARSQIRTAIGELDDSDLPRAEKVHQLRKRCKKMRGLVRLVRDGFEGYKEENVFFRDLARRFSDIRDATAVLEMLDGLEKRFGDHLYAPVLGEARRQLDRRRTALDDEAINAMLGAARQDLEAALERSASWSVKGKEHEVLAAGMARTAGRARKAMDRARMTREANDLHEWRKRVKYHTYHVRLLKRSWPEIVPQWAAEAKALSDCLGDHHDDAVFREETLPSLDAPRDARDVLRGLLIADQRRLERGAFTKGARLFAEKPDALGGRFARYWRTLMKADPA